MILTLNKSYLKTVSFVLWSGIIIGTTSCGDMGSLTGLSTSEPTSFATFSEPGFSQYEFAYDVDEDTTFNKNLPEIVQQDGMSAELYQTIRQRVKYVINESPEHGELGECSLATDNMSCSYTPKENWSGEDKLVYHVVDGSMVSRNVVIKFNVKPVNDLPVGGPSFEIVVRESHVFEPSLAFTFSGHDLEDGNNVTFEISKQPDNGTIEIVDQALGTFRFTPNTNYSGDDTFSYQVVDSEGGKSESVQVTCHVVPIGFPFAVNPGLIQVAEDTEFISSEDQKLVGEAEGALSIEYIITDMPDFGTLELTDTEGNFKYVPNKNYFGEDFFTYKIVINNGTESYPEQVKISVTPVNDAPVASPANFRVTMGKIYSSEEGFLQGTDIENDTLTYTLVDGPTHGALSGNAINATNGTFTYTAKSDTQIPEGVTEDSFTYKVVDQGGLASEIVTVIVELLPAQKSSVDFSIPGFDVTVCGALGENELLPGKDQGLEANVRVLRSPYDTQDSIRKNLLSYLDPNISIDTGVQIFMSRVNVTPREFTSGFETASGPIKNPETGVTLDEWFSVNLNSFIKLPSASQNGYYEFATISDDGSLLIIEGEELVSRLGTSAPKMHCNGTAKSILLDSENPKELKINYFQGPRTKIALMLLWRKVANPAINQRSSSCSVIRYDTSFTEALTPSLVAEGWEVVPSNIFKLPESIINPCIIESFSEFAITGDQAPYGNEPIIIKVNGEVDTGRTATYDASKKAIIVTPAFRQENQTQDIVFTFTI